MCCLITDLQIFAFFGICILEFCEQEGFSCGGFDIRDFPDSQDILTYRGKVNCTMQLDGKASDLLLDLLVLPLFLEVAASMHVM